jgi:lipid II:glycine glycyltransferase (peptidoglycan interpeptide bridge formation enzyme)
MPFPILNGLFGSSAMPVLFFQVQKTNTITNTISLNHKLLKMSSFVKSLTAVRVDRQKWESDLSAFESSFFISPQWVESAANENCSTVYLNFEVDGQVVSKISGLLAKGGLLKGNRLYFYSGPALKTYNSELQAQTLAAILDYAKRTGVSKVSVRPFDEVIHEGIAVPGFKSLASFEYKIVFSEGVEHKDFSYGYKQNVKKARKAGAQFHMGNSQELLNVLFDLIGSTLKIRTGKYGTEYNPLGLLNLNEATLRNALRSGMGKFYYATVDDKIVSIQLNLELGDRTYGFLMGSDTTAYKMGIPSFIDFNVIQFAQANGLSVYNLGGAPSDDQGGAGISKYKEAMGAKLFPVYGYYSPFLGPRAWVYKPVLWSIEQVKSFKIIRKLQLLASKKGWLE